MAEMRRFVVLLGRAQRHSYAAANSEEISVTVPTDSRDEGYLDGGFSNARKLATKLYAEKHSLKPDQVTVVGAFAGPLQENPHGS